MRISKKAEQKNFRLNTDYYNERELSALVKHETIGKTHSNQYIVFGYNVRVVKVVLDDFGYYTNVAVTDEGDEIYIHL